MRDDPWTVANRDKEQQKIAVPPRRKPTAETPAAPTKPTISGPFWTGTTADVPSLKESSTCGNEQMIERARKRLSKRAKRGFRGYPIATVALYGPDDTRATKLTVGIVPAEYAEATDLRRWFSEGADIRNDAGLAEEVLAFIDAAGAKSVVMTDRIIGCPHEEGIDYQGPTCPSCPFWAGRDRWTGRRLH